MRLSTDFTDSEVFKNFAKIVEQDGMLNKTASNDYPEYDFIDPAPELDISLLALADTRTQLYGVTKEKGEDLINAAHPGGGTVTQTDVKPEGDLAKVETIVEQHRRYEDVATSMPTGKYAQLSERLVSMAEKFEDANMPEMADEVTNILQAIAFEIQMHKTAEEDEGLYGKPVEKTQHHEFEPVEVTGDPEAFRKSIRSGNLKAQQLINQVRTQMDKSPIKEDGIMGRNTRTALSELGIEPGSYHSWGELFSKLAQAIKQNISMQQISEGPYYKAKPEEIGKTLQMTQKPSGEPASYTMPSLPRGPLGAGARTPLQMNDDGMVSEAQGTTQTAPRALTPEQHREVMEAAKLPAGYPEVTPAQITEHKVRRDRAARQQAMEKELAARRQKAGPRTEYNPEMGTYQLTGKIPTVRPTAPYTGGLGPKLEREVPVVPMANPPGQNKL